MTLFLGSLLLIGVLVKCIASEGSWVVMSASSIRIAPIAFSRRTSNYLASIPHYVLKIALPFQQKDLLNIYAPKSE